jgi:hypothetical protein
MCTHGAWVEDGFVHFVHLSNDGDDYYVQVLKTPDELNGFIKHLIRAGIDAWGVRAIFPNAQHSFHGIPND